MPTDETDAEESVEQSDDNGVSLPASDATVEPNDILRAGPPNSWFKTTVDVALPTDIATAVAYRAGVRSAREGQATPQNIHEIALDYAQVWPRFLVRGEDLTLVEWVDEHAGVSVDHSQPAPHPDQHLFNATAEYRPGSEFPLHITMYPPERVLEDVGGWAELTESVRLYHGGECAGEPEGEQ